MGNPQADADWEVFERLGEARRGMKYTFDSDSSGHRRQRSGASFRRASASGAHLGNGRSSSTSSFKSSSKGSHSAGAHVGGGSRASGGTARVLDAAGRALKAIGSILVAALQVVLAACAALWAWAAPRLRSLNAPLVQDRRRLVELFVIPLAFLYFEVALRLFAGSSLLSGALYTLLFIVGYSLLVDFIASLLHGRAHRIVMTVALALAGALYAFESIMYASFQVYMNFVTVFAEAGDVAGKFSGTLLSSILGGIPRIVVFMAPAVAYWVATRKKDIERPLGLALSAELLAIGLAFCLLGTGCSVAFAGGKYAAKYEFDTAIKTFGLLTGTRLDVKYALFGNSAASSFSATGSSDGDSETSAASDGTNAMDIDFEELAETSTDEDVVSVSEYVASLTASEQNEYTGIFEGKNVILICAEAFSGAVISEELTPTLYRLQHNGIYFSDYYQPAWGGSTSTGEFSFLMGLVPTNGAQSMQDTSSNNNYFTLANQLQRLGYFTLAFHNGTYNYYSREETHYNLGYDVWLAYGNGLEELVDGTVSDRITMNTMLSCVLADGVLDEDQPFCLYFMTMSGHASYIEDSAYTHKYYDDVVAVVGEDTYSERILYYLCYQMALEEMLEELVDALEEAGIADDTVICLTTDHYPYGLSESTTYDNPVDYVEELYAAYYGSCDADIPWERDVSALILWSGCLEEGGEYEDLACEVSEPTYSLDILPTLSNLFGLEYDSRLLVGRDVFSDEEALVIWTNHSWKTERGTYNASTGEYTWNEGYEYDEEYVERINTIVANKITFSTLVLSTDYYGVLFGEDDVGGDGDPTSLLETLEAAGMTIDSGD